jgi:hypothetical protein
LSRCGQNRAGLLLRAVLLEVQSGDIPGKVDFYRADDLVNLQHLQVAIALSLG